MQRRLACVLVAASAALLLAGGCATLGGRPSPEETRAIAADAYVYGYPLVLMDATRRVMTAVPKAGQMAAPLDQFANMTRFPDPTFRDVVSPNADTLYSSAWLDLANEPIVLHVPDTKGRYYLMPMLDGWTNVFASPGKRTTGTRAGDFAIVGPQWSGTLPEGVVELRAPTDMVWIIGRTQANGRADYAAVHAIQAGYRLTPLSSFGKPRKPPAKAAVPPGVDRKTPPAEQVAALSGEAFFARLAELMKANPPVEADAPILARMAEIGVAPGEPFPPPEQKPAVAQAIDAGVKDGRTRIAEAAIAPAAGGGWNTPLGLGQYGTDYLKRAMTASIGLGANLSADAVYAMTRIDADGETLSGAHRYVLHFDRGAAPPVDAFWSLSLYDDKQAFVKNPIGRYAIGDRDHLRTNRDGSLEIQIQHASPGASRSANWLPAPKGPFNLILRMYWPQQPVVGGTWTPPAVQRAD